MTTYRAYFRTDADFATRRFEADTPEQALALARSSLTTTIRWILTVRDL